MSVIGSNMLAGASGAAGGGKVYVDDVFSTFLYKGNGTARSINNGIDLAGEGGLVWIKNRDNSNQDHVLNDTERGAGQTLRSDSSNGQFLSTARFSAFNSNGFSVGTDSGTNNNNEDIVSWTFRKAPGFFDVVTYTGDGVANRAVPHSLGSVPGMIIVKQTNTSGQDWHVWHRSINPAWTGGTTAGNTDGGNTTGWIGLNLTNAYSSSRGVFTYVNSTAFGVYRNNLELNSSGSTYVAYIFAHDDAQYGTGGDESIIKCGGFTATNTWGNFKVDLGFEPQFVLFKRTDSSGDWIMLDSMRGIVGPGDYPLSDTSTFFSAVQTSDDAELKANSSDAEQIQGRASLYSQGFLGSTGTGGDDTYIYMAIRRPNKPPEAGTDVFAIDTKAGTSPTPPTYYSGFPVDWSLKRDHTATHDWQARARLTGDEESYTNLNNAASIQASTTVTFDQMDGVGTNTGVDTASHNWMFKRAPGFMDVVAWTGEGGSNRSVVHNLTVTPTLWITKRRSSAGGWLANYTVVDGSWDYLQFNDDGSQTGIGAGSTLPTSTAFFVDSSGGSDTNGATFIAYLFATLSGISKIGSYSGDTGYAVNVDCGFTAGARFILIKRTDSTGDWYVWDTNRGIVSGNDPYLLLNSNAAQVENTDYVDTLSSGFTVTASAPAALNATGGTYLFLAIA